MYICTLGPGERLGSGEGVKQSKELLYRLEPVRSGPLYRWEPVPAETFGGFFPTARVGLEPAS